MHLNKIEIAGFLKIQNLIIDPVESINIVAGSNETGKSSLAEAIGFALRGLPARVDLKKEYGQLVNDACEEARIVIDRDDNPVAVTIKKQTARVSGGDKPENVSQALHCAVDMYHFIHLSAAERRKMLFRLGGAGASVKEVVELLGQQGANPEKVESIKSLLAAGFDTAAESAKDKASECRKEWQRITGENYGSDKAENWTAPGASETITDPAPYVDKVRALKQQWEQAQTDATTLKGKLETIEQYEAALDADDNGMTLADAEAQQQAIESQVADSQAQIEALEHTIAAAEGAPTHTYTCPDCNIQLVFEADELKPYVEPEATEAEIAEWQASLDSLRAQHKQLQDEQHRAEQDVGAFKQREHSRSMLAQMGNKAELQQQLSEAEARRDQLAEQYEAARQEAEQLQVAADAASQAVQITDKAKGVHEALLEWQTLRELLEPDGLPKQLMAKALDPLNVCLGELADAAGWHHASIDEDMVIHYGGYSYALCSESAQWRASAMLAAAISYLAGVNFLLVDRADVLDLNGRSQLLDLTDHLAGKGLQIIICATLKAPPQVDGVKTIWLDDAKQAA